MSHGRKHFHMRRVRIADESSVHARRIDAALCGNAANDQPTARPVPKCDWCGRLSLRLREAAKLFEDENLTGEICRACADREHEQRESASNDGRYHGASFEE